MQASEAPSNSECAAPAAPVQGDAIGYAAEIRFGVVMYGGVSLAIYINGVSQELFEMARATPVDGMAPAPQEAGTAEIYSRLAWLAADPSLVRQYAQALGPATRRDTGYVAGCAVPDLWQEDWLRNRQPARLAVDVIAGTSAGGINGIFLAKALVNAEPYSLLRDLWVNEGDLALLLHDEGSYAGLGSSITRRWRAPESLLNSDRMYLKLVDAMDAMSSSAAESRTDDIRNRNGESSSWKSPFVEELDLYITTTDIRGSAVPLRLHDNVVHELRHKQSFHFSYERGSDASGDFDAANNPFLAFAARCTSSFPFAFEPMMLDAVRRLQDRQRYRDDWNRFFPELRSCGAGNDKQAWEALHFRAYGDGGYLDNKPFSYVVDTLSRRQAATPVERKLIYIEPAPQSIDSRAEMENRADAPDAVSNSVAALIGIPRYETIREDLQAVLHRNRRIERIERLVRFSETSVEMAQDAPTQGADGRPIRWSEMTRQDLINHYGISFLPYWRLRILSTTDRIADNLAARWDIDQDSDHVYALRAIVRAWRDRLYKEVGREAGDDAGMQTTSAFLDQFDLEFRIRRLGFTLRKIDQAVRLIQKRFNLPADTPREDWGLPDVLSDTDTALMNRLRERYKVDVRDAPLEDLEGMVRALKKLKEGLRCAHAELRAHAKRHQERVIRPIPPTKAEDEQARRERSERLAEREELISVLSLLLSPESGSAAPCSLMTKRNEKVPVKLPKPALPSLSRTLQETVFQRARELLKLTDREKDTNLQQRLEEGVERMRIKRAHGKGGPMPADWSAGATPDQVSARAWALLGKPRFESPAQPSSLTEAGDADLDSRMGRTARGFISDYYLRFDRYDQISFPVYYDTGTGEPATVQVFRVSPRDARSLVDESSSDRRKLAGTELFNFGAFLDRRWRQNDILWGRLDGAERLVTALLPSANDDAARVREELVERLHGKILRETLAPEGSHEVVGLLWNAMGRSSSGELTHEIKRLFNMLGISDGVNERRLIAILCSMVNEQGLVKFMRDKAQTRKELDPKAALSNAARAVTVSGRVLDVISQRHDNRYRVARWVARTGLALQALVFVSVPGSIGMRFFQHWLKLLYAFELFLIFASLLFASSGLKFVSLGLFGITGAIHLTALLISDFMSRRRWVWKACVGALVTVMIVLTLLGVLTGLRIIQEGPRTVACELRWDAIAPWLRSRMCGRP